jgi:peptidoglycan/LPS O-acetylase OafA/YrhL
MQGASRDIPVLNGVRSLAVLIVFVSHASDVFFGGKIVGFGAGQLGVMLFFVLSGFLMAHLYLRKPADAASQWRFIVNRMARIYPMFAVVVVACFAIHSVNVPASYGITSLRDVWLNLSFAQGYNVFWTIGPEVVFYVLFLAIWKAWRSSWFVFAGLIIAMVAASWLPINITSTNSLARLQDKLPYFLVGCLLGSQSDRLIAFARERRRWSQTAFWLCLAAFIASFPQVIRLLADVPARLTGDPWPQPWSFPYYLFATTCVFVASLVASPPILTNRVVGFLGKVSFSFYLLHVAVLWNAKNWLPQEPLLAIVLAFAISIVISSLTYITIESPMRQLIRHLAFRRPGRSGTASE